MSCPTDLVLANGGWVEVTVTEFGAEPTPLCALLIPSLAVVVRGYVPRSLLVQEERGH